MLAVVLKRPKGEHGERSAGEHGDRLQWNELSHPYKNHAIDPLHQRKEALSLFLQFHLKGSTCRLWHGFNAAECMKACLKPNESPTGHQRTKGTLSSQVAASILWTHTAPGREQDTQYPWDFALPFTILKFANPLDFARVISPNMVHTVPCFEPHVQHAC